ncbi:hypothetical protein APC1465_1836 [Bifidobacterium longum]|nr:hypothetical protein APC1465_1836 [Bifidobacterium longum]
MFIIFSRMQFRSRIINTIASWTLGVYLITDRNYIRDLLWTQWFAFDKLKWPDFCSALTVRRLVPLDVDNTRFPPLRVSCSPGTGAGASSSTTRPTGTSPIPGPSDPRRVCAAIPARSCTRRRRFRPWRCRTSRRRCRSTASITLVVYTVPVHCVPWSLWWIRPSAPPRDAAHEIACSNACNGSSCVFMVMAHAHPTIRRAYTSVTNAV